MPDLGVIEAIRTFHARYAGASERVFGRCDIGDGRTSYAWIADQVPAAARRVLDLGCADGATLQAVLRRLPEVEGVGLDMSPEELALARERLGPRVRLHRGLAQDLPYPDGHFDAVVSHMALMLMEDVDKVFAEMVRVLAPSGVLVFVVERRPDPTPWEKRFFEAMQREVKSAGVRIAFRRRKWGLDAVTASLPGFAVHDEPLALAMDVPAAELWSVLGVISYYGGLLPDARREALRAEVAAIAAEVARDGVVPWTLAARGFVARRE